MKTHPAQLKVMGLVLQEAIVRTVRTKGKSLFLFSSKSYTILSKYFSKKSMQFGTGSLHRFDIWSHELYVFKPHYELGHSLPQRDPHNVLLRLQIPESAVEMPGDPVSSLDVKFGGLDFGLADTKPSFTTSTESDQDGFPSTGQSAVTATAEQQPLTPLPSASQSVKVGHLSRVTPRF